MRAVLLSLLVVSATLAADPVSIDKLVEQLGSKSFAERERATKAIRDRGPEAVPALRKALESPDEEVRRRAELLLPALEIDAALLPTRISISLKDEPLLVALKQLEKQAGVPFAFDGKGGGGKRTIEFQNVPFWEALERLSTPDETILFHTSQRHQKRLSHRPPAFVVQGPFRIDALWIHEDRDRDLRTGERHERLTLSLGILAEPRITFLKVDPARVLEAIDSDGKSLVEPENPDKKADLTSIPVSQGRGTYRAESTEFSDVRLRRGSDSAARIRLVKGVIPVKSILIRKNVEVTSKLTDATGKTIQAGEHSLTITKVENQGGNNVRVEVLAPYDGQGRIEWHERFKVQDEEGNNYQMNGRGTSSNGREVRISMYFASFGAKKLGPPARLLFEQWIVHDHEIPFEFRDLDLP